MDKKNKNPNVPNLRFNHFTDPWHNYQVSELLTTFSTNSLSWDQLTYDKESPLKNLHYGLIHNAFNVTCIHGKSHLLPYINQSSIPTKYTLIQNGDLILADASEDRKDVGRPVEMIDIDNQQIISGLHTIHARNKTDLIVNGFKGFYFQSEAMKKQLFKVANGSKIYGISSSNFNNLSMSIPDSQEQRKIVDMMIKIEDRILTQSKIINDYIILKNWINNMINSELKCQYLDFSSIYKIAKEGGTPSTSNPSYYFGEIPFIKIEDLTKKYITSNKTFISKDGLKNSSTWIIPKNSIILSNGATIGNVSINTYPVATKQGILGVVPKEEVLTEYLFYLLNTDDFKRKIRQITTKGTIDCAYIKDINHIKVKIPDIQIQKKITQILASFDSKIELENTILNSLKEEKQYLLKNLFI